MHFYLSLIEALISQMKHAANVETVLTIFLTIYEVFRKKVTNDIFTKISNYLSNCMFIRKVVIIILRLEYIPISNTHMLIVTY